MISSLGRLPVLKELSTLFLSVIQLCVFTEQNFCSGVIV